MGKRDLDINVRYAKFSSARAFDNLKAAGSGEKRVYAKIYISTDPQFTEVTPDAVVTADRHATWGDYNDLHFSRVDFENAAGRQVIIQLYNGVDENARPSVIVDSTRIPIEDFRHEDRNPRPAVRLTRTLDNGTELTFTYRLGRYTRTIDLWYNDIRDSPIIRGLSVVFGFAALDNFAENHFFDDHNN